MAALLALGAPIAHADDAVTGNTTGTSSTNQVSPPSTNKPARVTLFDPEDGWLDASGFLDTAYGFVPLVMPITEPAVG